MKKQYSVPGAIILALGALATQSCESTDGQNSYYNNGRPGYYRDGRYAEESGYYHERGYNRDDYQSDHTPALDVRFGPDYIQ